MKKRFTDIEKWGDLWFRKLPVAYKLLWGFLCDNVDNAGVWKVDAEAASFYIGAKVDSVEALRLFNEGKPRVAPLDPDRWLLRGFIAFQYGKLSAECKAHNGVFSALERHGLRLEKSGEAVVLPEQEFRAPEPADAPHKEAEKAPSRPIAARKPAASPSALPEWLDAQAWAAFAEMRAKLRRPLTPAASALIFKRLEEYKAQGHDPKAVLEQSVEHSWQGVFPLRDRQSGAGAASPKAGKYSGVRRISTGEEAKPEAGK